ncbi:MAG: T9SS type A sorting domain-containing protein [Fluviicola sp.]
MKKLYVLLFSLISLNAVFAQCDTTDINGDLIISTPNFMSGVYRVTGRFKVNSGITVFVQAYETNGCGMLHIIANEIIVDGTINGDFSGMTGGTGGNPGSLVSSLTGDVSALTDCSNKDNTGFIQLEGGLAGINGLGLGGGVAGTTGGNGSGPKQQCLSSSDDPGMIGGSGGAGAGAGGSYGGDGGNGGNGGAGSSDYSVVGLNVSAAFPVVGGVAGSGGNSSNSYGTLSGMDIHLGSGGAGAGGGGRSFDIGLGGGTGGSGGGLVILESTDTLVVTGTITVNGENGGQGGNGGESPKCCSDGCDNCGEATLSTGSGGGGGAGGGSGGGILLKTDGNALITGVLSVNGGNGGNGGSRGNGTTCDYDNFFCGTESITSNNGNLGNDGGAGAGGRIKIFVPICSQSTITPTNQFIGGTGFMSGENGTYFLGCSELSIMEKSANFKLDIYPNPIENDLMIIGSEELTNASITIIDAVGKTVFNSTETINENPLSINLSDLAKGNYQLIIQSEAIFIVKKVTKN